MNDEALQDEAATPHLLVHGSGEDLQHVVATSLDEARSYAEYLVNEQGDETARIFEMRELDIAFTTYYQVHLVRGRRHPVPPPDDPAALVPGEQPTVVAISA
ncbi:MAG: hypothetical protein AAGA93_11430 [Actinomycetota bacterium]